MTRPLRQLRPPCSDRDRVEPVDPHVFPTALAIELRSLRRVLQSCAERRDRVSLPGVLREVLVHKDAERRHVPPADRRDVATAKRLDLAQLVVEPISSRRLRCEAALALLLAVLTAVARLPVLRS